MAVNTKLKFKFKRTPENEKVLNMTIDYWKYTEWKKLGYSSLNIINLIKFNWQYMPLEKYPDREFIIDIWGEPYDPEITFYEKKPYK